MNTLLFYANLIAEMASKIESVGDEARRPTSKPRPQKKTNPKAYAKRCKQKESRKRNRK